MTSVSWSDDQWLGFEKMELLRHTEVPALGFLIWMLG